MLRVKAGVDTILKLFVQLNRDVVAAQKAGYRHAVSRRRLIRVAAGRNEELLARQQERRVKRVRKEKLAEIERPDLGALGEDSNGSTANFDEPGENGAPDFR